MKKKLRLGIALGLSILSSSAAALAEIPAALPQQEEGAIHSAVLDEAVLIAQLDQTTLSAKLSAYGISARNGAKIYRLTYHTRTPADTAVVASGLLMVPDGQQSDYPWISVQHGTLLAKADAPSLSPGEGMAEVSQGFVAVVPDYLGFGASAELFHPYILEKAYAAPLLDMLRAAREYARSQHLNLGPLFLKGYSEGGYATLALQKAIETDRHHEFHIVASAPAAGPFDVDLTGVLSVAKPKVNPANLPFLLVSYSKWSDISPLDLSDVFVPELNFVIDTLSGDYSATQIFQILPRDTLSLFKEGFTTDFLAATPTLAGAKKLHQLLKSQNLIDGAWQPQSQTRFYHCIDDEQIPVAVTEAAFAKFKVKGAPVSADLIPSPDSEHPYLHTTCPAIFASLNWFQDILNSGTQPSAD